MISRNLVLKILFFLWIILWVLFVVREDKHDQYKTLRLLYSTPDVYKYKAILGDELYAFLLYCKDKLPENANYEILGFEKFSIDEVRLRYLLWPLKQVQSNGEFKILYNDMNVNIPGYSLYASQGKGRIMVREEGNT